MFYFGGACLSHFPYNFVPGVPVMEKYSLQKRSVLSFKTGHYEDGDISYIYVIHMYSLRTRNH